MPKKCMTCFLTSNISVLSCEENNSTTIKHVYKDSANFIERHDVDFGINKPLNLTEMVPVTVMGVGVVVVVVGRVNKLTFVTYVTTW